MTETMSDKVGRRAPVVMADRREIEGSLNDRPTFWVGDHFHDGSVVIACIRSGIQTG